MSEWKELKIDNLPPDILTGDYATRIKMGCCWVGRKSLFETICSIVNGEIDHPVEYRKPEPEAPTHEEIMTSDKYWRGLDEDGYMVWEKADLYCKERGYYIHDTWRDRSYFSGRSSWFGIPPDA